MGTHHVLKLGARLKVCCPALGHQVLELLRHLQRRIAVYRFVGRCVRTWTLNVTAKRQQAAMRSIRSRHGTARHGMTTTPHASPSRRSPPRPAGSRGPTPGACAPQQPPCKAAVSRCRGSGEAGYRGLERGGEGGGRQEGNPPGTSMPVQNWTQGAQGSEQHKGRAHSIKREKARTVPPPRGRASRRAVRPRAAGT
jgi:hypothetical protein